MTKTEVNAVKMSGKDDTPEPTQVNELLVLSAVVTAVIQ